MRNWGKIALCIMLVVFLSGCPPKRNVVMSHYVKPLNLFPYQYGALSMIHSPADEAVVHFAIQFKGGLENYPDHLQGIEKLAIRTVAESAPEGKSQSEFLSDLDWIGASIGSQVHEDYSLLTMTLPVEEWRTGLKLMLKWVANPTMDIAAFERAKETALLEADRNQKDPSFGLHQQTMEQAFPGKAYGKDLAGTPSTLKALTLDRIKEYYRDFLLQQCRITFIWTGRPERFDVEEMLVGTIGKLPEGNCQPLVYVPIFPQASTLNQIGSTFPQYQLEASFPSPDGYSPEAAAMDLALRMLEDQLSSALTVVDAYPISMRVSPLPLKQGVSTIYFHTSQPNKCAETTIQVLKKALSEGFTATELEQAKRGKLTELWLSNESGQERMQQGAKVAVATNFPQAVDYPRYVAEVSAEQVKLVLNKYCTALSWTISGPATGVSKEYYLQPLR